jgi:hypothetical protein
VGNALMCGKQAMHYRALSAFLLGPCGLNAVDNPGFNPMLVLCGAAL